MAKGRDTRLTLEQSQTLTRLRTMGTGTALPIHLENSELIKIAAVILADVGHDPAEISISLPPGISTYYDITLDWFSDKIDADFVPIYLRCLELVPDFDTYFKALAEIHKRRRKYAMILSRQPLPTMAQVAPRSLLEFGIIASPALASWLTWRKWFYDVDNRSAQETGYLFEPILASGLGGVAYGARNSPIRRRGDRSKGRQVDCIVDHTAYEFKLRVTIAASGQGRFGEELDFAEDCRASGYRPVLLVLDPTPSHRLDDLVREFGRAGGDAYIGNDAWAHLESQAGPTMGTFIEKYVRRPISEVDACAADLLNLRVERKSPDGSFILSLFNQTSEHLVQISRHEDQTLALEDDEAD